MDQSGNLLLDCENKSLSDSRSSFAYIVHLSPRADAMRAIPEDNSELGRESPLDLLLRRRQRRREAVFSDHIDRHDSREFLKVTRAFPLPRVSSEAAGRSMHAREKVTARTTKRESRITQDRGIGLENSGGEASSTNGIRDCGIAGRSSQLARK
jgi:hypothetical protein